VDGRSSLIGPDDVVRASRAIGNRLHRTPLFSSATLGEAIGGRAFLKAELFQKTGSFKPRGVLAKLAALTPEERARGVITTSAGNLAAGLAYGAARERIGCLVVTWKTASAAKIDATRRYGAAVDVEAATPGEALDRMAELARESGRLVVHPWDDPLMIAGHGTLGLELVEDRPDLDVVVVPVGGASLVSGVATAVKGARPDARVVAVEPERAAGLRASLEAGEPVRIDPDSLADGLNAPSVGARCLAICERLVDELVTVTEAEIEAGFHFLYGRAKLAAEPAGAVAVAALLAGKVGGLEGKSVAAVVSGGNIGAKTASGILGRDEG
jgi:threonine dehydratase